MLGLTLGLVLGWMLNVLTVATFLLITVVFDQLLPRKVLSVVAS